MHAFLTLFTAILALLGRVTALPLLKRLVENEPWHLANLAIFTSTSDTKNSSISFDLVDNNARLQLETTCSRSILGSIKDPNAFYPCTNNTLAFRWDGRTLRVQRTYIDTRHDMVL
jgi:hypothetical protein